MIALAKGEAMANALYYGDNLAVLRDSIAADSVDLIYLDPPFNSQANYNVLFKGQSGKAADAQIEAFEDTWHWGEEAERAFAEVLNPAALNGPGYRRPRERVCTNRSGGNKGTWFRGPSDLVLAVSGRHPNDCRAATGRGNLVEQ
ncbi:MAG: hypothetical protein ACREE9_07710 [Stellaceae bacterium]